MFLLHLSDEKKESKNTYLVSKTHINGRVRNSSPESCSSPRLLLLPMRPPA